MGAFTFIGILRYILDLGPTVMLPLVILFFGLALGLKPGKAFKSGLMIGIGFVGIGLVIGLMLNSLGPAAKAMADRFGMSLNVLDLGWPGASPMTWASSIAMVSIPVAILINIVMLGLRMTKVVNVDIWNIWHMTFTGAILNIVTGSYWVGILGVVIHAVFAYKLGDWFSYDTQEYFGLEGIAIPHGTSAYCAPIAVVIDAIIEKIPGVNKIEITSKKIEKRFGVLGEPVVIGLILGVIVGFLAKYNFKDILQLAVKVAGVMYLMPKVVKPIMEGLLPISTVAREKLATKFKGEDYIIGLDPALLLGDSEVIAAGILFIPLTLIIAIIIPGNRVLPFGDLATIGFFIAMAVAVHKGNMFRTIISGFVIMFMTIWISTQTIPFHTALADSVGMLQPGTEVASLDQGGAPIVYILSQIFKLDNVLGFIVIVILYGVGLVMTYTRYRRLKALKIKSSENK